MQGRDIWWRLVDGRSSVAARLSGQPPARGDSGGFARVAPVMPLAKGEARNRKTLAISPHDPAQAIRRLTFVNTAAMNAHVTGIARNVTPGAQAVLILDGAGWHGPVALEVPDNLSLLTLPPYSPEMNPVENVWADLRANKLAITVFESYHDIVDACCNV